ncbi:MAG: hypothetical protein J6Y64_09855 [Ruminococcus sp.]|nr:hypothetical protein [Ruminococcus sp.]
MKTCKEMTECVFERIDEYEKLKTQKKRAVIRTTAILFPLSAAIAAGLGVWNSRLLTTPETGIPDSGIQVTDPSTAVYNGTASATEIKTTAVLIEITTAESSIKTEVATAEITENITSTEGNNETEEQVPTEEVRETVTEATEEQAAHIQTNIDTAPVTAAPYEPNTVSREGAAIDTRSMDVLCWVIIDGDYYVQRPQYNIDSSMYASDEMIGCSNDFEGLFRENEPCGKFYTVKEDKNVIVLEFYSGGRIVLVNTGSKPIWFE